MKKILIILTFLIITQSSYSQFIPIPSWGVKGGLNFADIGGEEADNVIKTALNLGVYGQKHFNAFWHLKLELLLSGQGHGAPDDLSSKLNLLNLNLPVTVAYDPSFNFGFHAGIQPGLLLSAKAKFGDTTFDVKDQFNAIDLGLVLGGQYYLMDKKVTIILRYIHGFTNLTDDPAAFSRFNRVIQISASYMIARLFEE